MFSFASGKIAIIFSSVVQAAEASLAYLTWNRMMGRMFLQNCSPGRLLEGSRSGEWGNQSLFTGVDGGGKVWRVSVFVSCLCLKPQSSLGRAPLIQSWEQKTTMCVSRTLDDPCSLLVIQRLETCLYPEGQRTD